MYLVAFLGPQHLAPRASASHYPRELHVRSETFFLYAKKSNLAAAATLPMSRALQRAVVSTGRCSFGPTVHGELLAQPIQEEMQVGAQSLEGVYHFLISLF